MQCVKCQQRIQETVKRTRTFVTITGICYVCMLCYTLDIRPYVGKNTLPSP